MAARKRRARGDKKARTARRALAPRNPDPDGIVSREMPGGGILAKRVGSPLLVFAARAPQPPPPAATDLVPYIPFDVDARSWGEWKRIHYLSRLDCLADLLAEMGGAALLDAEDVRPRSSAEVLLRATRWERPNVRLTFALPRPMAGYAARDRAATKACALCSSIYALWRAIRARGGTESIYWTTRYYEAFLVAFPGEDPFAAQSAGGQARSRIFADARKDLEAIARELGYERGDLPPDAVGALVAAAGARSIVRGASESSCRRAIERVRARSK